MSAPLATAGTPSAISEIAPRVEARLGAVLDGELTRWTAFDQRLRAPIETLKTLVMSGGKRLRPAFCHWGAIASGGSPGDASLVDAGAALELLHAFALLHDDVMDASDTRRGAVTTHLLYAERHASRAMRGEARRFGEGIAVLLGDLSHALADRVLGTVPPDARAVWDELRVEVDAGQLLDLIATAEGALDREGARRIARCKSGGYTVERPLLLGSALAGGDARQAAALSAYGGPLGEAFQLKDDLLGAFGAPEQTGKPVGDDLREGKPTVLLATAHQRATDVQREILRQVGDPELSPAAVADLQQVLIETGARASVEQDMLDLRAEAIDAVRSPALADEARDALCELAIFVTERYS